MSPGQIKRAFASAIESIPRRIERISSHLFDAHGVRIELTSPDEVVDKLPSMIAASGGTWNPKLLLTGRDEPHPLLGPGGNLRPTPETEAMLFDGALLWGEVFRHRYPEAKWSIGKKPRSSVDYGDPVLVGPYQHLSEFGVRRQLNGAVGRILLDAPDTWTLSNISRIRAFELGFAPDPRRRIMP